MSEDLSDLIKNVKSMMDSGNLPDDVKYILNNLNSSSNIDNTSVASSNNNSKNSNNLNIDMNTILKMKSMIDDINFNNDPRANLLQSLKPYLRETRKDKLDQYINLLNISKIAEIINHNKKENNGDV